MRNTGIHTRSHSFINVGKLVHLILKQQQQCRNAALLLLLTLAGQSYLALHNLPEVFAFQAKIHTHVHKENTPAVKSEACM